LPKFKDGYIYPSENPEVIEENIEKYGYKNRLRILHFSDLESKLTRK